MPTAAELPFHTLVHAKQIKNTHDPLDQPPGAGGIWGLPVAHGQWDIHRTRIVEDEIEAQIPALCTYKKYHRATPSM